MTDLIDRQALIGVFAGLVPYAIDSPEDDAYARGLDAGYRAVVEAPAVDVRPQWISVKDRLPEKKFQDCWVMVNGEKIPEIDWWDGHRGERANAIFGDCQVRQYVRSGWYYNDCNEVTHWMPIECPEPPKEVE